MPWKVVELFTTIIDGTDNIREIRKHVVIRTKSGKSYESDKDNLRVACATATNLLIKFGFYSCHGRLPREYRYVLP